RSPSHRPRKAQLEILVGSFFNQIHLNTQVRQLMGTFLAEMIHKLNEVTSGFANYFRIGNVKKKFERLDEWIRMRVRAYVREKCSMESNWRIPNKVLAQAGLVSMVSLLTARSQFASEIK